MFFLNLGVKGMTNFWPHKAFAIHDEFPKKERKQIMAQFA